MGKNLELKIAFDVCVNYCNKHDCENCYFTTEICPLLIAKTELGNMRDILSKLGEIQPKK